MVVIRDNTEFLNRTFGRDFIHRLQRYASVIGFSVEMEDGTVKVEFNPDRPDLYSFYSLNRSMEIFYSASIPGIIDLHESDFVVNIEKNALSIRPYFLSLLATGNALGEKLPRIIEYQERLHDTIGRERKSASIGIHSISNSCTSVSYSLKESSSVSIKTFDGDFDGTAFDLISRHPLGKKYSSLLPSADRVNVIEDMDGNVMSVPPISNSFSTRLTENSATLFVDIEGTDKVAVFHVFFLMAYELQAMGYSISMPRHHGMDKKIITELVAENGREIKFSYDDILKVLGFESSEESISDSLRKMGYVATPSYNGYVVTIPGNRIDVMGAVDVIEDIAKGLGYDQIPFTPIMPQTHGIAHRDDDVIETASQLLIGSGYQEVKSFVVGSQLPFSFLTYRGDITLFNPKSSDFSVVRDRLYVNMLEIIKQNKRRSMPQKIFEIGDIIEYGNQKTHLCFMIHDTKAPFSAVKQVLEYLVGRFTPSRPVITKNEEDGLVSGRCGSISLDSKNIGFIGEMHPALLELFSITDPISLGEIDISALLQASP